MNTSTRTYLYRFLFSCLIGCVGLACGKDDETLTNYDYFLNTYINNVKYTTNSVSTLVLSNQTGCLSTKLYSVTNVGQINVDSFFLDCYFKHYTKSIDFALMKTGTFKIYDGGQLLSSTGCTGDLVIGLVDNSIPSIFNNTILQTTNIVHNITSITKKDSTANSITYVVAGNFSCNFKNTNNRIIPVVGTYKLPVKAAK
ncbi:MAG: hypothetical protein WCH59_08740 [Chitinophagia bacterium]|jgi:hypothetical protein